MVQKGIEVYW